MLFFVFVAVMGAQRESTKPKENSPAVATGKNNIEVEEQKNGPYIDKGASKNVTALLGKTAYLNCRVKNLGNKTVRAVAEVNIGPRSNISYGSNGIY